jgi:dTDP-glucose 4,6-dehydratase
LEENVLAGSTARSVNVRIFNCFGPGMDFRKPKRVVPQFIQQLSLGQSLQISGEGKQRRTLCYYEDTVRGILMALQHTQRQKAPYHFTVNIGGTETFSIIDLAHCMMQLALDLGLLSTPLDIRTDAPLYSQCFDDTWDRVPDITCARNMLGFEPEVPVREGLTRTLWQYRDLFVRPSQSLTAHLEENSRR